MRVVVQAPTSAVARSDAAASAVVGAADGAVVAAIVGAVLAGRWRGGRVRPARGECEHNRGGG